VKLQSIGDRLQPGTYRVHSRFHRVVNLLDGRRLASIVGADVGAGPINVVFSGADLSGIRSLSIDRETLTLDGGSYRIDPDRYYDSAIEVGADRPVLLDRNLTLMGRLLVEESPPRSLAFLLDGNRAVPSCGRFESAVLERLSEGVSLVFQGDIVGGARILRGCGFGLTPSGDDFVAGLLIAMHLLRKVFGMEFGDIEEAVHLSSRSGNILSDTLLTFAREGRLTEKMKNLVTAVLCGTEDQVRRHTEQLLLVGDTSGADLGTGFCMTMQRREVFLQFAGSRFVKRYPPDA